MKPLAQEWVEKAEGDFVSTRREIRARKSPNYDSACFHAQQCAEKYMKAVLQQLSIRFPKTHDLTKLFALLVPSDPLWETVRAAEILSDYAVQYRYPGESATKEHAHKAFALCRTLRTFARSRLRLR